jgi:deoxycytidylate deaminase
MSKNLHIEPMTDDARGWFAAAYKIGWELSDDQDTKVGAALVIPMFGGIIELGANRFPWRVKATEERLKRPAKYDYIIHAEQDVLLQAARSGKKTFGNILVCPWALCKDCAKFIIQAGISQVITHHEMHEKTNERWKDSIDAGIAMLKESGVEYIRMSGKVGGVRSIFDGVEWCP